jgi:hypothetical protein
VNREQFLEHLRSGEPITKAVQELAGVRPEIMTIAEESNSTRYVRYGLMMTGDMIAALVTLQVDADRIPSHLLAAIKSGEPIGLVLDHMKRIGNLVLPFPRGIRTSGALWWDGQTIGEAQEIFTVSLLHLLQETTEDPPGYPR